MNKIINIIDLVEEVGEEVASKVLSSFCSGNKDVDDFIHSNAIDFANRHIAVTYFTVSEIGDITGAFTLANKVMQVPETMLSNTQKKRMERQAIKNDSGHSFMSAAYLIAQFGKNYINSNEEYITGEELMCSCWEVLLGLQKDVGGNFVWLECERDNQGALSFYSNERIGFKEYAHREDDKKAYTQMLQKI